MAARTGWMQHLCHDESRMDTMDLIPNHGPPTEHCFADNTQANIPFSGIIPLLKNSKFEIKWKKFDYSYTDLPF